MTQVPGKKTIENNHDTDAKSSRTTGVDNMEQNLTKKVYRRGKYNDKMEQLKTHLSIRINQAEEMSNDGFHRWGHKSRNKVSRTVYKTQLTFSKKHNNLLPTKYLTTDEAIGEWLCQYFGDGDILYVLGYSHGKTKTHVKLCKLAKVKILDAENSKYEVTETERLNRYWFRQNTKVQKKSEEYKTIMEIDK